MNITGWLFDIYPVRDGMAVWVLDEEGKALRFTDPFQPVFYLRLEPADARRVQALAEKLRLPAVIGSTEKMELFSGEQWRVTSVTVRDPLQFAGVVRALQNFFPHFAFYNSNIPVPQMYLYERGVFPLARCRLTTDGELLRSIVCDDSPDAYEYRLPPLRVMEIRNTNGLQSTKFFRTFLLELRYDGTSHLLEQEDPRDVLDALNWHLYRYDPDIILTSWGDATLLPALRNAARTFRRPLLLNRGHAELYRTTAERSYWTYGEIIHRDAATLLAGRLHMDAENSFIMGESDIDGVIELARLTQLPLQKQSRAAIGTGLASMQMSYAYRHHILIPAEKKEGEDFKTADDLLLSDRGGLVFLPDPGYHEQVAELDFASMYPSLMERHNISPETINCSCCRNHVVPELGYSICEKRRGIVPATLLPVLRKRAYYKSRKKNAATLQEYARYDRRQNALKWMLVTCFGYLGYKNARFGRIEAHESVNAFSREALLTAKEIAEQNGFHLVHAIIDCLWLKKPGSTRQDYEQLCSAIGNAVGVTISLEGIYNWLLFPPSKTDPGIPTAGRYVGWYDHGELKMRGIEARRRDVPRYIKQLQARILDLLADARGISDIPPRIPDILQEAGAALRELRHGRIDPKELVLRRRVQKEMNDYTTNTLNALVVRELAQFGMQVRPGEIIEYIIIDQSGKRDPQKAKSLLTYQFADGYDTDQYAAMLLNAVATLLAPFGYDADRLRTYFRIGKPRRKSPLPPLLPVTPASPGDPETDASRNSGDSLSR
ncbi:MAG TPA: DNA polymerase domain-containing protein [Bacteroidota bacterium]|nr:DNA polymerase domain-containing protein [Bacteroidota bacterium]